MNARVITGERNGRTSEKGQSLIELAIGVFFMILLLSGIVDLGRAFFSYMTLRDAVQEGALYASLHPTHFNGIQSRVWDVANDPIDVTQVTVGTTAVGPQCAGGKIEVFATYQYPIGMPFLGAIIGSQTIPMKATVTESILLPPC